MSTVKGLFLNRISYERRDGAAIAKAVPPMGWNGVSTLLEMLTMKRIVFVESRSTLCGSNRWEMRGVFRMLDGEVRESGCHGGNAYDSVQWFDGLVLCCLLNADG